MIPQAGASTRGARGRSSRSSGVGERLLVAPPSPGGQDPVCLVHRMPAAGGDRPFAKPPNGCILLSVAGGLSSPTPRPGARHGHRGFVPGEKRASAFRFPRRARCQAQGRVHPGPRRTIPSEPSPGADADPDDRRPPRRRDPSGQRRRARPPRVPRAGSGPGVRSTRVRAAAPRPGRANLRRPGADPDGRPASRPGVASVPHGAPADRAAAFVTLSRGSRGRRATTALRAHAPRRVSSQPRGGVRRSCRPRWHPARPVLSPGRDRTTVRSPFRRPS